MDPLKNLSDTNDEDEDEDDEDYVPTKEELANEDDLNSEAEESEEDGPKKKKFKEEKDVETVLTPEERKKIGDKLWAELNGESCENPSTTSTHILSNQKTCKETNKSSFGNGGSESKDSDSKQIPGVSTFSNVKPKVRKSGLVNFVSNLGKKNKMGTLTKSKLDWDSYKKEQGIEDELKQATTRKDGFIERQAFLSRADQRQFEIERDIRSRNRLNK